MKPDQIKGQYDPIFCGGTFTNPEYWVSATFDAKVWSNDGTKYSMNAANAYKAGEWQHVAFTVKGGASPTELSFGKLYLNGELIASGDVAPNILDRDNAMAYFGANYWDGVYSGEVDDIIMIKGVLNKREINAVKDHILSPDKEENDANASGAVIEKINAIGNVEYTADSKALIDAARKAYDRLTDDQKALVHNFNVLIDAEKKYQSLKDDADNKTPVVNNPVSENPVNNNPVTIIDDNNNTGITATAKPAKTKITKLLSKKSKTLTIKWKKVNKISGYQIQYSTKKSFKKALTKTKKIKKAKTTAYTIKKLKTGKKYFVRIRAYKNTGSKVIYGKWSKVTAKKVK